MGFLLFYLNFTLPFMFKVFRRNRRLLAAVFITISVHQILSITNAYIITTLEGGRDASSFHQAAVGLAINQPIPSNFNNQYYTHLLSLVYRLFGPSLFLGQELSILVFILSCVVLIKLLNILKLSHFRVKGILLFGLLPTSIIYNSYTMREVWQTLFFLLLTYYAIKLRIKTSISTIVAIILSGFSLLFWHNGLAVYGFLWTIVSLVWGLKYNPATFKLRNRLLQHLYSGSIFLVIAVVITAGGIKLSEYSYNASSALLQGQALEYAQAYREGSLRTNARTVYGVKLDISSFSGLLYSVPLVVVNYMFAPFPWQVRTPLDMYAMLEGWFRLLLIYSAILKLRKLSGPDRDIYFYLLMCFFSLEFIWALGTTNWGTALRHHLVAYGCLLVAGGPELLNSKSKKHLLKKNLASKV